MMLVDGEQIAAKIEKVRRQERILTGEGERGYLLALDRLRIEMDSITRGGVTKHLMMETADA